MDKAKSIFETFEKEFADYVLIGEFIDGESFEIIGVGAEKTDNKNRMIKMIGRLEYAKNILTQQLMEMELDEEPNIDSCENNEEIF
jgi:hypothetical protein